MVPLHEPGFYSLASGAGALGEVKIHGIREFIAINDRLSTFLTAPEGKRTIVQRYQGIYVMPVKYLSLGSAAQRVAISASSKMLTSYVLSVFFVLFILGVATNAAQAGDYQLGVGDVVKIVVYGNEDLTTEEIGRAHV